MANALQASDFWQTHNAADLPPLRLFVLVDTSAAPGLVSTLRDLRSLPAVSLFDGAREAGAQEVAPVLVDLGALGTPPSYSAGTLIGWLMKHCLTTSAWLTLHSPMDLPTLVGALKRRLDVQLPDDYPALLRYFDTRVFASLMQTLSEGQRQAFLGVAARWLWLDRGGGLHSVSTTPAGTDPLLATLCLNEAQQAAMIDAAEPDAVVHQMRQAAPDLCADRTGAALHQIASQCVKVARSHGIEDTRQLALFCLVEVEQGPQFYHQAAWQEGLAQMARSDRNFVRLVQDMETGR